MTTVSQKFIHTENKKIDYHSEHEVTTNKQKHITPNVNMYENQQTTLMNKKYNWRIQLSSQPFHQNNLPMYKKNYKSSYHTFNNRNYKRKSSNSDNYLRLPDCNMSTGENYIKEKYSNSENTDIDNSKHCRITTETDQKKTPISLLNEWAMSVVKAGKKNPIVSYAPVAITGHVHRPIFTYTCQVYDKTVMGEGKSKKEAKQNAAARMWEELLNVDLTTNSDRVITSTTITDNFEINEIDSHKLTINEGSETIDETDLDTGNEESKYSNYDAVKIAYCQMNPIGALQELSTTYKWPPPFYHFQKLGRLKSNQQQYAGRKTVLHKVTCQIFYLETIGTDSTKKGAKRKAALLMYEKICDIGTHKLNKLKLVEPKIILYDENSQKKKNIILQERSPETAPKWNSANSFRLYFTAAVNTASELSLSNSLFEEQQKIDQEQYQMELEQSIVQYNPNSSAVDQLQIICQKLGFQAIYVCVNDLVNPQKEIRNNISQDKEYAVLLQVSTIPITVTIGHAVTVDMATEVAAKYVLHTFKAMLLFTSSLCLNENNNEQEHCTITSD